MMIKQFGTKPESRLQVALWISKKILKAFLPILVITSVAQWIGRWTIDIFWHFFRGHEFKVGLRIFLWLLKGWSLQQDILMDNFLSLYIEKNASKKMRLETWRGFSQTLTTFIKNRKKKSDWSVQQLFNSSQFTFMIRADIWDHFPLFETEVFSDSAVVTLAAVVIFLSLLALFVTKLVKQQGQ